jgi:hypothetical protein
MWISKGEYRRLLRQLATAEARFDRAVSDLATEREARMVDVRHLVSMLLRKANTYPLPEAKPAISPDPHTWEPVRDADMDPGEYEALLETAAAMGMSQTDLNRKLHEEGYTDLPS